MRETRYELSEQHDNERMNFHDLRATGINDYRTRRLRNQNRRRQYTATNYVLYLHFVCSMCRSQAKEPIQRQNEKIVIAVYEKKNEKKNRYST